MKKEKIAISIDRPTREMVDAMVDGLSIRSRSQAIEFLIAKGIEHQYVKDAVILLRAEDIKLLLKTIGKKRLLLHQLELLEQHGVKNIYLVTSNSPLLDEVRGIAAGHNLRIIIEERPAGTIPALMLLKKE